MSRHRCSDPPRTSAPYRWMTKASLHDSVWRSAGELARDARVAEIGEPPALAGDDLRPQAVVEGERAEQFRRVLEILRRELHARAAERVGHGGRRVGQHRHVGGHRLDQRHAEALVLAQRDVDRGVAVVDRQLLVGHRPGEDEAVVQAAGTPSSAPGSSNNTAAPRRTARRR